MGGTEPAGAGVEGGPAPPASARAPLLTPPLKLHARTQVPNSGEEPWAAYPRCTSHCRFIFEPVNHELLIVEDMVEDARHAGPACAAPRCSKRALPALHFAATSLHCLPCSACCLRGVLRAGVVVYGGQQRASQVPHASVPLLGLQPPARRLGQ